MESPRSGAGGGFGAAVAALLTSALADTGARLKLPQGLDSPWFFISWPDCRLPEQGWKLHLSAFDWNPQAVLEQALPILAAARVAFKVIGDERWLRMLNEGSAGLPQVGKFVTVYPDSDDAAIAVAAQLEYATRGLTGPNIPSDRRVRGSHIVHYRYGSFGSRHVQTRMGEVVPALVDTAGALVPDVRSSSYVQPDWVTDPFAHAGLAKEPERDSRSVGRRYHTMLTLSGNARHRIEFAFDSIALRTCVVKRAPATDDGHLPEAIRSRFAREAALIDRLSVRTGGVLTVLSTVFDEQEAAIVFEDVEGETVENLTRTAASRGEFTHEEFVVELERQLAEILEAIHDEGLVYGDLKSPNVIVQPDGRVRLVDLETLTPMGAEVSPGMGTQGYTSPRRRCGRAASISDDVYSLGALLYFAATAAEPSRAPDPERLLARPIQFLNPTLSDRCIEAIERCLDPSPRRRFRSVRAVTRALGSSPFDVVLRAPPASSRQKETRPADRTQHYLETARAVADALAASAESIGGADVVWRSRHRIGKGELLRHIDRGVAGTVIALAELVEALQLDRHASMLRRGARGLLRSARPEGETLPGLYIGEGGVAAAILRAGEVLADGELVAAAIDRARWVARLPHVSPDVFHGSAGRAVLHLLVWSKTQELEDLDHAIAAGSFLLETATREGPHASWAIPDGFETMSGTAPLGYAHGAAGVCDVLLSLFEATGNTDFLAGAHDGLVWVESQEVPILDGAGVAWPVLEGAATHPPFWCHGAAGIGRSFLHAAELDLVPRAGDLAERAGYAAAHAARWGGPTLCHGLSGNIQLLLDLGVARAPNFTTAAHELAQLLDAFALHGDGGTVFVTDSPRIVTPDYMAGYAGVGATLLRLADPSRPQALTPAGLTNGFAHGRRRDEPDEA